MSLFGGQTNQHRLAALDELGQIAAIYPNEQSLWQLGPPITDPGDQQGNGAAVADAHYGPLPPSPTPKGAQQEEDWLQEVMNGETSNGAYGEEWVNLAIGGPAGFGNWNEQPWMTGHSQIVQSNPGAEQGWGVGPARRWAHYPFSELQNPTRNLNVAHCRNGMQPETETPETSLYYRTQLAWEQQWDTYKQRVPVTPVVPVAESVPHVQTVPTYGGGFVQYGGLDVPAGGPDEGIY